MKASIQNQIQEFIAVVLEKDEMEFGDMSEVKALLPLLAYQDSNSDVEIIIRILTKEQSASGIELSRLTP